MSIVNSNGHNDCHINNMINPEPNCKGSSKTRGRILPLNAGARVTPQVTWYGVTTETAQRPDEVEESTATNFPSIKDMHLELNMD